MMQERSFWGLVSRLLVLIIMAVTPDPQYITAERFTQLLLSPQLLLIASINLSSPHTGNAFLPLKTRLPVGQGRTPALLLVSEQYNVDHYNKTISIAAH